MVLCLIFTMIFSSIICFSVSRKNHMGFVLFSFQPTKLNVHNLYDITCHFLLLVNTRSIKQKYSWKQKMALISFYFFFVYSWLGFKGNKYFFINLYCSKVHTSLQNIIYDLLHPKGQYLYQPLDHGNFRSIFLTTIKFLVTEYISTIRVCFTSYISYRASFLIAEFGTCKKCSQRLMKNDISQVSTQLYDADMWDLFHQVRFFFFC